MVRKIGWRIYTFNDKIIPVIANENGELDASNMIKLRNITAGYNKPEIIKNINLIYEKGSITSIIGKNGYRYNGFA